jgi:hypothetical protein
MNDDDQMYNDLFKRAVNMQYKFHNFTAYGNHPDVHVLQNEIHQLIGDIRMHKNSQSLNTRIRTIEHQLNQGQHTPQPYMNYADTTYLRNNYEQMRQNVLKYHEPDQPQ